MRSKSTSTRIWFGGVYIYIYMLGKSNSLPCMVQVALVTIESMNGLSWVTTTVVIQVACSSHVGQGIGSWLPCSSHFGQGIGSWLPCSSHVGRGIGSLLPCSSHVGRGIGYLGVG